MSTLAVNLVQIRMSSNRNFLLPPGTLPDARLLLAARAVRAFGDGYVSLLLPYYLTLLGYSALQIGLLVTATLLGSGLMTLAIGFIVFLIVSYNLQIKSSSLLNLKKQGTYLVLSTKLDNVISPIIFDPIIKKHQDKIAAHSYVTF